MLICLCLGWARSRVQTLDPNGPTPVGLQVRDTKISNGGSITGWPSLAGTLVRYARACAIERLCVQDFLPVRSSQIYRYDRFMHCFGEGWRASGVQLRRGKQEQEH